MGVEKMESLVYAEQMKSKVFENLLDFVEKEYFEIMNKIDKAKECGVDIGEVEKLLDLDIKKLQEYVDLKILQLLEKIKEVSLDDDSKFVEHSSLRDIMGNSILNILNKIAWVVENFDNEDERVKRKIFTENSVTRRMIAGYVERENSSGVATYYIDELCQDEKKLKMELSSENGYLEKFEKCFIDFESNGIMHKRYPTGGEKLPFFKFFSELEKGQAGQFKTKEKALDAMSELKIKKIGRPEEEILEKENVIKLINRTYDLQDRPVSRDL